ncbi:DUF4132 domain-containing protein [Mycobacterium sp. MYCO198283]|uniref:DUF4132 domain-containing protein n=1 Tax=Mycobacterium sp. MYCO198283 TaxID=2883505 RepID=UPI001E40D77A|nr:DUF4132 domain-containing protein [Mycobacterium sp. MYCO198283]MCG5434105.1 DUF4132 domain-containing protein [Mycobacterium sp. MYCO198283]
MPAVRWAGRDTPVAPSTLRALVERAVLDKGGPDAELRERCAELHPADRDAFAGWLLREWLATGSTAAKSVLAVVACCAGDDTVAIARAYLERPGARIAPAKALLTMLAASDRPHAVQALLAGATRFRSAALRDAALTHLAAVAARHGWTAEELADRTVPDAGFDNRRTLRLDYGSRAFSAVLHPDLSIALRGPDGRPLTTLPAARQADDPAAVAAAKKALAAARSLVRSTAPQQTDRLYGAMCAQRRWPYPEWSTHLQRHPLVGPLTQRLVWTAAAPDGTVRCFRPLDDGTLTDTADDEVVLGADALVAVAHSLTVPPAEHVPWRDHLADYGVTPLFDQFAPAYRLPAEAAAQRTLGVVEGCRVRYGALRDGATRRGYVRGSDDFQKVFPTLQLSVVFTYTGDASPQNPEPVAMSAASFLRLTDDPDRPPLRLRLGEVPAVLLSEVHHDLMQIVAAGTGAAADRRRQTGHR